MTTKAKIKQLEEKCDAVTNEGKHILVKRQITQDGRLMDEEGYLLNTEEIERIKKENEEIGKKGGLVVYLTEYFEPKVRIT